MSTTHVTHGVYRPDIDGLRALAVLLVLINHAFPSALTGGFVGVDIFFVISGYLITGIVLNELNSGSFSIVNFYIRRANRIFPSLLLVLVACLGFGWLALYAVEFESLGRSVAAGAGFFANINLYREIGYWDAESKLKPLLHLWSLGVEEQFYLLFPAFVWSIWKYKRHLFPILLIWALASGIWTHLSMRSDQAAAFYLPMQRSWEIACGAMLAYLSISVTKDRFTRFAPHSPVVQRLIVWLQTDSNTGMLKNVAASSGLAFILIAAFSLNASIPFPGKWTLLPVGGTVLLILAGASAWVNRTLLSNRVLVYVGLISFPLYLWHWPLLSFAQIVESGIVSVQERSILVALSFILAIVTFHAVERPLRFGRFDRKATALFLTAILAFAGATGYFIAKHGGMPERAIEMIRKEDPFTIQRPTAAMDDTNACFKALPKLFRSNLQAGSIPGTQVHCLARHMEDVSIAMIGDSNAGHFAKDLHERFGSNMLTIHSSGRPFIRGINDDANSQSILDFLAGQAQIKTIVISHQGVEVAQGGLSAPGTTPPLNPNYEVGLVETIRQFKNAGKRVIFLSAIPMLSFDPKGCQQRPFASSRLSDHCVVPLEEVRASHSSYLSVVQNITRVFPNLEIVDAMDYLCDSQNCYAKRDGRILYTDRKHVNSYGSGLVTGPLINVIDQRQPRSP